jgi:acyl-homoserine-lactone acylase
VSEACQVLARWDLRNDVGSRGVLLFDAYWNVITARFRPGQWGTLFTVPFDPADPLHTPRTLNTAHAAIPTALADAVNAMDAAGIPLDASLGDHQYVVRDGRQIPISGGSGRTGVVNTIEAVRDQTGASSEVRWGSSFIFVTSFDGDRCPDTRTLLTYSQSADPTSAHHSDQTELFASKRWVTERFCEKDIRTSPGMTTVIVEQRL